MPLGVISVLPDSAPCSRIERQFMLNLQDTRDDREPAKRGGYGRNAAVSAGYCEVGSIEIECNKEDQSETCPVAG